MLFMAKSQHRREHMVKSEAASIDQGRIDAIGSKQKNAPENRWLGIIAFFGILAFFAMPMMVWLYFL